MAKFEFDISVEAKTSEEAVSKLKSASVLISRLTQEELAKLASIIVNDPAKAAIAKQYLMSA